MEDKHMTKLDILGRQLKAREEAESLVYQLFYGQWHTGRRPPRPMSSLQTMDEILERDKEREKDGFPPKIKWRRVITPSGKVASVPWVAEEKLIHGEFEPKRIKDTGRASISRLPDEEEDEDLGETTGHGKGEVGDIIGEVPIIGGGAGEGGPEAGTEPGAHEEEIYETGKRLIEKYQLPNLEEKGKKVPTDEYIYDLTSRHEKAGQVLDKKATLKKAVKTNILLGRITKDNLDPSKIIIAPRDTVFRVLSKERVWKSRAVVFFLRDYSGSMWGEPTQIAVEQHLMIYGWLMVQYENLVIPRFIVHDTEAEEVTVKEYFRKSAGGGTFIPSGYKKITEIVESEGLAIDYNIFVFQATDGEDWDDGTGREAIPEIEKILGYANRMGACVLQHPYYSGADRESIYEQYVKRGGFLQRRDLFRMHVMPSTDVTEDRQIEAIEELIAPD